MLYDLRVDIRNRRATIDAFKQVAPDYVIHLAAQALVREGYRKPVETYETNVNGTMHVLEASDQTDSIKAQLIITTDKVYRDDGRSTPYVESDPLGGKDPYSASKAMADILAQEWLSNERSKPGAIARAGNVIGAGDSSRERLIPDIIRAYESGQTLTLRYPEAVRPWQHVLDCLRGYISLLDSVSLPGFAGAWNFGPHPKDLWSVLDVVDFAKKLVVEFNYAIVESEAPYLETKFLNLDSQKIQSGIDWQPRASPERSVSEALAEILPSRALGIREILKGQIKDHEPGR
jgi:CDP-glucose 4,6-dehydratase